MSRVKFHTKIRKTVAYNEISKYLSSRIPGRRVRGDCTTGLLKMIVCRRIHRQKTVRIASCAWCRFMNSVSCGEPAEEITVILWWHPSIRVSLYGSSDLTDYLSSIDSSPNLKLILPWYVEYVIIRHFSQVFNIRDFILGARDKISICNFFLKRFSWPLLHWEKEFV